MAKLLLLSPVHQFSITIVTSLGKRTFFFSRAFSLEGYCYHISVFASVTNSYFTMNSFKGDWEFSKPHLVPDWIIKLKGQLVTALEENHDGGRQTSPISK